jgi:hypothetical protein
MSLHNKLLTETVEYRGSASGCIQIGAVATSDTYPIKWPAIAPAIGAVLRVINATTGETDWCTSCGAAPGENNTASNEGIGTGLIFKQKTAENLEFRSIASLSTVLSVANVTDEMNFDIVQANITTTGALAAGSIAVGYGTINTGADITTTTTVQGGTLQSANVAITGSDTKFTGASGANTITVPNAQANALSITDGTVTYLTIDSVADKLLLPKAIVASEVVQCNGALEVNNFVDLFDVAEPSNPSVGVGRLYKKAGDPGLWWRPDASGEVYNLLSNVDTVETNSDAVINMTNASAQVLRCTNSSALVTVTLPGMIPGSSYSYSIVNGSSTSQDILVKPQLGDMINSVVNDTVLLINQYDSVTLFNDGAAWYTT